MASLRRALFSTVPRILSIIPSPLATHQSLNRLILGSFAHLHSSQSLDVDISDEEESKRRLFNRLLYRSKQRGYLELDLILGNWVEAHIHSLDENGIESLVHVLDLESPDLWNWLSGQEQPPEAVKTNPLREKKLDTDLSIFHFPPSPFILEGRCSVLLMRSLCNVFTAVWQKVTSNLENHSAPGTRAKPGQSWVRGWDDFKKGRDSPIAGNQ